jgi:hypothetical protein
MEIYIKSADLENSRVDTFSLLTGKLSFTVVALFLLYSLEPSSSLYSIDSSKSIKIIKQRNTT